MKHVALEIEGKHYVLEITGGEEVYAVERLYEKEGKFLVAYRAFTTSKVYTTGTPEIWSKIDKIKDELNVKI